MEAMMLTHDEKILIDAIREIKLEPLDILTVHSHILASGSENHKIVDKYIQKIFE